jgi:hypothetical protein
VRLPALALAAMALACAGQKTPRTGDRSMTEDPETHVALEWSMALDGAALVVELELTNKSDKRIYVPEALLVKGTGDRVYNPAPGRLVVGTGNNRRVAELAFGVASASNPMAWIVSPLVRPLEAGQSYSKRFTLGLPLATWHNVGWNAPFAEPPTEAVLSVWYLTEEPPQWYEVKNDAGETLKVPLRGEPRWITGEPRPIPTA